MINMHQNQGNSRVLEGLNQKRSPPGRGKPPPDPPAGALILGHPRGRPSYSSRAPSGRSRAVLSEPPAAEIYSTHDPGWESAAEPHCL